MSTSVKHKPAKESELWFSENKQFVRLIDGREIGVPLEWFPNLRDASAADLNNWRFIGGGIGIHWETLDEDISVEGLMN
jgi:hypothetical protein